MKKILIGLFCLALWILGCSSPRLMSYKEFSKIDDLQLPRILHLSSGDREVLYFGTYHSNDVNDTLFNTIENVFNQFKPEILLHEGNIDWPNYKNIDSTIQISGELGYSIPLAIKNDIDFESIEPSNKDEYKSLLKKFDLRWVVLMYMCRQIENQQRFAKSYETTDEQFIGNMNHFFRMLKNDGIPLTDEQLTFSYWKETYHILLNQELNWREFNPELYYPNQYLTKLNEINRASDKFRNLYMIETILNTSKKYAKVFVLVGGGHLIIQEDLLTYKFKEY